MARAGRDGTHPNPAQAPAVGKAGASPCLSPGGGGSSVAGPSPSPAALVTSPSPAELQGSREAARGGDLHLVHAVLLPGSSAPEEWSQQACGAAHLQAQPGSQRGSAASAHPPC